MIIKLLGTLYLTGASIGLLTASRILVDDLQENLKEAKTLSVFLCDGNAVEWLRFVFEVTALILLWPIIVPLEFCRIGRKRKYSEHKPNPADILQYCQQQGFTDPFLQDDQWYAFPPHGVLPVQLPIPASTRE